MNRPPVCPTWLDRDARQEWARIAPELHRLGLLTAVDGPSLAAYCVAYSQLKAGVLAVREHGAIYRRADGSLLVRPEVNICQRSMQALRQFAHEFGLTPSARSSLVAGDQSESVSAMAALLD